MEFEFQEKNYVVTARGNDGAEIILNPYRKVYIRCMKFDENINLHWEDSQYVSLFYAAQLTIF